MYKVKVTHDIFRSDVDVYRLIDLWFFKFWLHWTGTVLRSGGDAHEIHANEIAEKYCIKYNCHNSQA